MLIMLPFAQKRMSKQKVRKVLFSSVKVENVNEEEF